MAILETILTEFKSKQFQRMKLIESNDIGIFFSMDINKEETERIHKLFNFDIKKQYDAINKIYICLDIEDERIFYIEIGRFEFNFGEDYAKYLRHEKILEIIN